jgi:hypothetical protein
MSDEPKAIPRRMAYRLCAEVLFAESDRLRQLTPAATSRRRGPGAAANVANKLPGRQQALDRFFSSATRLIQLSRDDDACRGPGADAAALGYLLAWLAGWGDGLKEAEAELEIKVERDRRDLADICLQVINSTQGR